MKRTPLRRRPTSPVHWKVENQQFVEYERYQCDPEHPLCPVK
jgi:hypothetical protein